MTMPDSVRRIVLDANVMVSAFLVSDSAPAKLLYAVLRNSNLILLFSRETFAELERVLKYPKIRKRLNVSEQTLNEILLLLAETSEFITPKSVLQGACRDLDDEKYLSVAVSGEADAIVTGDRDLLVLNEFKGIPIQTTRDFLDIHREAT